MDAEQQTPRLPSEDHSNQPEFSHEYFSPISKCDLLSPADKHLLLASDEYFSSLGSMMPQVSRKVLLDDSDFETPGKRLEELGKESECRSSRTLQHASAGKTNHARPTYRNNVSPAIQKIIQMMRMPCLSTPLAANATTPTKRVASASRFGHLIDRLEDKTAVNDDSICFLRKRLDASFSPDVASSRRHSVDSSTLRTMLARENDSSVSHVTTSASLPTECRSRDFMDSITLMNDEPVASAAHCETKQSPLCVQIVEKGEEVSSSEDRNQVSELYFLMMIASRKQRMKKAAFRGRP